MEKIKSKHNFPLINAVLIGLQDGQIIESQSEDLFFVAHKAGFSYLTESMSDFNSDVFNYYITSAEIPRYIHIYDPPTGMIFTL